MSIENFIITVFCVIDDELKKTLGNYRLRERGRHPNLTDSEVITMEIVGVFLGIDCDKSIWQYFKNHWSHFFPRLPDWRQLFLAHTICVRVNKERGNEPLQFENLVMG